MPYIRKCEQCGKTDARVSWPSPQDASKDPVFSTWTCPNCAWTEFDLVEGEVQQQEQPVSR